MNKIDEMIQSFRAAQAAADDELDRCKRENAAAAEASARRALPGIFGELWEIFEGRIETAQAKPEQVAFALRLSDLELDDFLVVVNRYKSDVWKFTSFVNLDWSNFAYGSMEELLAARRQRYCERRKRQLVNDLNNAKTAEQVHQAAALLLLHEPEDSAEWMEKRDLMLRYLHTKAAEEAAREKAIAEFTEAYRAYLTREAEVKRHNQLVAEQVQAQINTTRILRELEYGVRAEDQDVRVDSIWVTDQIPSDGWWQLPDGSKRMFFYPVSLNDGREVRPTDRFIDTYKSTYCGGGAKIYHWSDENVTAVIEAADFWKAPTCVAEPEKVDWNEIERVRRNVERELEAAGVIEAEGERFPF